eukprot:TRINITY_DN927_c5_g1_i1.p1 TRINITY_DN927_c5_g1~~TRINITY_DN927_c5_g1_i1.p1  ORF type:complete len:577 (+),score=236.76 TRINITY_DN927_c5_g1_i1:117-1847(+)
MSSKKSTTKTDTQVSADVWKAATKEFDKCLESMICPITANILKDPVLAMDGHSYERVAIQDWFDRGNATSPISNEILSSPDLLPNYALRNCINEYVRRHIDRTLSSSSSSSDSAAPSSSLVAINLLRKEVDQLKKDSTSAKQAQEVEHTLFLNNQRDCAANKMIVSQYQTAWASLTKVVTDMKGSENDSTKLKNAFAQIQKLVSQTQISAASSSSAVTFTIPIILRQPSNTGSSLSSSSSVTSSSLSLSPSSSVDNKEAKCTSLPVTSASSVSASSSIASTSASVSSSSSSSSSAASVASSSSSTSASSSSIAFSPFSGSFTVTADQELAIPFWNPPSALTAPYAVKPGPLTPSITSSFTREALLHLGGEAQAGNPSAINNLACCYLYGFGGVKKDEKQAIDLFEKAGKLACFNAINNQACCLLYGVGGKPQEKAGVDLLQKASDRSCLMASVNLGVCYLKGVGVTSNDKKAYETFLAVSNKKFAPAQNALADCFDSGVGVFQNPKTAINLYTQAADAGFSLAQSNLAYCYRNGAGVTVDVHKALDLYEKAATQGYATAITNLNALKKKAAAKKKT